MKDENGANVVRSHILHNYDFRLLRVVKALAMTKMLANYFPGNNTNCHDAATSPLVEKRSRGRLHER